MNKAPEDVFFQCFNFCCLCTACSFIITVYFFQKKSATVEVTGTKSGL